jgi:hypothetical protein
MDLNEAKQLLKGNGYKLIKEGAGISSEIIQALTSNGWELVKSLSKYIVTAPAKLVFTNADGRFLTLTAQSDDQQTWVAVVDDTNDPDAEEDVKSDLSYDDIINLFA